MVYTTASFENRGRDAAAVITNAQSQLFRIVDDFDFYVKRFGMAEGVDRRFASNRVCFFEHHWMKLALGSLQQNAKFCFCAMRIFFRYASDGRGKAAGSGRVVTQIPNSIAAFAEDGVGAIECFFHGLAGRFVNRNLFCHGVKAKNEALDALEKRVVKLPGDAFAFAETLFHARPNCRGNLPDAEPIEHQEENNE